MGAPGGPRRGAWAARFRRRADETGLSLVEICITLAIMGLAMAALLGGVSVAASTSDTAARQAQLESDARRAGEFLRSVTFLPCSTSLGIQYLYVTNLGGNTSSYGYSIDKVELWTKQDDGTWTWSDVTTNCDAPGVGSKDGDTERIKLTVTTKNGSPSLSTSLWVVKRRTS